MRNHRGYWSWQRWRDFFRGLRSECSGSRRGLSPRGRRSSIYFGLATVGPAPLPDDLLFHAQHLDDDALSPLPIELRVKHALPCTEIQAPTGHRQRGLMMEKQRFEMRVGIIFARLVMLVLGALGGELLQPFRDVLNQPALQVVHINRRRN